MIKGDKVKFTDDPYLYEVLEPNKGIFEDLAYCKQLNGPSAGEVFTMQQRYLVPLKNFLPTA